MIPSLVDWFGMRVVNLVALFFLSLHFSIAIFSSAQFLLLAGCFVSSFW